MGASTAPRGHLDPAPRSCRNSASLSPNERLPGVLALLAVIVATPLIVILLLGVFRETLGFFVNPARAVWLSYVILGTLLMILGFVALRARHDKAPA